MLTLTLTLTPQVPQNLLIVTCFWKNVLHVFIGTVARFSRFKSLLISFGAPVLTLTPIPDLPPQDDGNECDFSNLGGASERRDRLGGGECEGGIPPRGVELFLI